jgi:hypothetical protein
MPRPRSPLATLALTAADLWGDDWEEPAARALAPHAPQGSLSSQAVRQWATGVRPVPAWVADALPTLVADADAERRAGLARLELIGACLAAPASPDATAA